MESADTMSKYSSVKVEEVIPEPSEQVSVRLQLQIDAKVSVTGVSGKKYVFNGAGSIVDVDEMDAEYLLQKRQGGRQCCGGTGFGNQVFALVGD